VVKPKILNQQNTAPNTGPKAPMLQLRFSGFRKSTRSGGNSKCIVGRLPDAGLPISRPIAMVPCVRRFNCYGINHFEHPFEFRKLSSTHSHYGLTLRTRHAKCQMFSKAHDNSRRVDICHKQRARPGQPRHEVSQLYRPQAHRRPEMQ
jgi:hypothetical protein